MSAAEPVVLLVDDHPDSVEMYAMALSLAGLSPRTAENGEAALELASAEPPDVIVTDLTFPRMSGAELIGALRQRAETRAIPIIVLTGHAEEVHRQEALAAGADVFFVKPCAPDVLIGEVRRVLATRRAPSHTAGPRN